MVLTRLAAIAVMVGFGVISGCGDSGAPHGDSVPASSLRACSFDAGCDTGEICNIGQDCGPPVADGGVSCRPIYGDQLCHRDCSADAGCATGETCTEAYLTQRSDYVQNASYLCE